MKTKILNETGKKEGEIELPSNFSEIVRKDIILRVFESQKRRQAMGLDPSAGRRYSASGILRHRRSIWKTTYGKGIARTPRKIMSRSGSSFNWIGATAANTRGGRRPHGPKSWENFYRKINKKELVLAFNSALSATADKRFYDIKSDLPVVFDSKILSLKTKEIFKVLRDIFGERVLKVKKVRAGKGKIRGRRYRSSLGLIFIVASDENMQRKGIDIVHAKDLTIKDLTQNGNPGRLVCYTEKAIKELGERFK